jgi:putative cell wall-binding protein/Tol biopolymer transport system component
MKTRDPGVTGATRRVSTMWGAGALAALMLLGGLAPAATAAVPALGVTALVSADAAGGRGTGQSHQNSVSADGRFVAFTSTSALTGATTGAASQVFVKDLTTGAVRLVSADGDGGEPMLNNADSPSISADGRFVAFVAVGGLSSAKQVWVRDLNPGGSLRLVSVTSGTTTAGNGQSMVPSMAGDGKSVAFQSQATDLVPGGIPTDTQVYQADLDGPDSGTVRFVSLQDSRRFSNPELATADAAGPVSSFDGSVIAFTSSAANLTADSAIPGVYQIFTHDMRTGATVLVSAAATGEPSGADRGSFNPTISADGRKIVFVSNASNLTSRTTPVPMAFSQVYIRDLDGSTASTLVSVDRTGAQPADQNTGGAAVSGDGRRVAFVSSATNQVTFSNPTMITTQILVRDLTAGVNTLVSTEAGSTDTGAARASNYPSISADGRFVGFATAAGKIATSTDAPGNSAVYLRNVFGSGGPVTTSVIQRIGGADRYAVSADISRQKFDPGVPVAYVASGAVFADALSGSAAAGLGGGPVLLTRSAQIPPEVAAELARLRPTRIVVLGGTDTVSPAVQGSLASFVGNDANKVNRIAGADRYAVSAGVSAAVYPVGVSVAYVASGAVFPDALSGSAAAGLAKGPVLLTQKDRVPASVKAELARLKPESIVVLGGTATVADSVVAELEAAVPKTTRVTGADRYGLAAEVAKVEFTTTGGVVYVASGLVFPDALSGSAAAIKASAPVLLVRPDSVSDAVASELTRLKPTRIVVLGGEATVSAAVYEKLRTYLAP